MKLAPEFKKLNLQYLQLFKASRSSELFFRKDYLQGFMEIQQPKKL